MVGGGIGMGVVGRVILLVGEKNNLVGWEVKGKV